LNFIRIAAVDGNHLSEYDFHKHAGPRNLSRPQVGVLLSHQKCWQIFSESPAKYCAIFEDDVHLSYELKKYLDEIEKENLEFDVLKIETARKKILISRKPILQILIRKIKKIGSYHVGAAGYVLHRSFLKKLTQLKQIADTIPVDEYLFEYLIEHAHIVQLTPALVIQDQADGVTERTNTKSLIAQESRAKKRKNFLSKLFREIKRPLTQIILFRFGLKLYHFKNEKIDFV